MNFFEAKINKSQPLRERERERERERTETEAILSFFWLSTRSKFLTTGVESLQTGTELI